MNDALLLQILEELKKINEAIDRLYKLVNVSIGYGDEDPCRQ